MLYNLFITEFKSNLFEKRDKSSPCSYLHTVHHVAQPHHIDRILITRASLPEFWVIGTLMQFSTYFIMCENFKR